MDIIHFLTMLYFYYILLYLYCIIYWGYSLQNYIWCHIYQDFIITAHCYIIFYHFNNS